MNYSEKAISVVRTTLCSIFIFLNIFSDKTRSYMSTYKALILDSCGTCAFLHTDKSISGHFEFSTSAFHGTHNATRDLDRSAMFVYDFSSVFISIHSLSFRVPQKHTDSIRPNALIHILKEINTGKTSAVFCNGGQCPRYEQIKLTCINLY